jgi:hypothetical protein
MGLTRLGAENHYAHRESWERRNATKLFQYHAHYSKRRKIYGAAKQMHWTTT